MAKGEQSSKKDIPEEECRRRPRSRSRSPPGQYPRRASHGGTVVSERGTLTAGRAPAAESQPARVPRMRGSVLAACSKAAVSATAPMTPQAAPGLPAASGASARGGRTVNAATADVSEAGPAPSKPKAPGVWLRPRPKASSGSESSNTLVHKASKVMPVTCGTGLNSNNRDEHRAALATDGSSGRAPRAPGPVKKRTAEPPEQHSKSEADSLESAGPDSLVLGRDTPAVATPKVEADAHVHGVSRSRAASSPRGARAAGSGSDGVGLPSKKRTADLPEGSEAAARAPKRRAAQDSKVEPRTAQAGAATTGPAQESSVDSSKTTQSVGPSEDVGVTEVHESEGQEFPLLADASCWAQSQPHGVKLKDEREPSFCPPRLPRPQEPVRLPRRGDADSPSLDAFLGKVTCLKEERVSEQLWSADEDEDKPKAERSTQPEPNCVLFAASALKAEALQAKSEADFDAEAVERYGFMELTPSVFADVGLLQESASAQTVPKSSEPLSTMAESQLPTLPSASPAQRRAPASAKASGSALAEAQPSTPMSASPAQSQAPAFAKAGGGASANGGGIATKAHAKSFAPRPASPLGIDPGAGKVQGRGDVTLILRMNDTPPTAAACIATQDVLFSDIRLTSAAPITPRECLSHRAAPTTPPAAFAQGPSTSAAVGATSSLRAASAPDRVPPQQPAGHLIGKDDPLWLAAEARVAKDIVLPRGIEELMKDFKYTVAEAAPPMPSATPSPAKVPTAAPSVQASPPLTPEPMPADKGELAAKIKIYDIAPSITESMLRTSLADYGAVSFLQMTCPFGDVYVARCCFCDSPAAAAAEAAAAAVEGLHGALLEGSDRKLQVVPELTPAQTVAQPAQPSVQRAGPSAAPLPGPTIADGGDCNNPYMQQPVASTATNSKTPAKHAPTVSPLLAQSSNPTQLLGTWQYQKDGSSSSELVISMHASEEPHFEEEVVLKSSTILLEGKLTYSSEGWWELEGHGLAEGRRLRLTNGRLDLKRWRILADGCGKVHTRVAVRQQANPKAKVLAAPLSPGGQGAPKVSGELRAPCIPKAALDRLKVKADAEAHGDVSASSAAPVAPVATATPAVPAAPVPLVAPAAPAAAAGLVAQATPAAPQVPANVPAAFAKGAPSAQQVAPPQFAPPQFVPNVPADRVPAVMSPDWLLRRPLMENDWCRFLKLLSSPMAAYGLPWLEAALHQKLILVLFVLGGLGPNSPVEKLAASYCTQGGRQLHRVNQQLQPTIAVNLYNFGCCAAILVRPFPNPVSAAQMPQAHGLSMPGAHLLLRPAPRPPAAEHGSTMAPVYDPRVLQDWIRLKNLAPSQVAFGADAVNEMHEQGVICALFIPRGHFPDMEVLAPHMRAAGLAWHIVEEQHPLFAKVVECQIAAILAHPVEQRKHQETPQSPANRDGTDPGQAATKERSSGAPESLTMGRRVVVFGLTVAKHLNGQSAVLKELDTKSGRWQVDFGNGQVKALKVKNLVMTANRGL